TLSLFMAYPPFALFPAIGALAAILLSRSNILAVFRAQSRNALIGATLAGLAFAFLILVPGWSVTWTFERVLQNISGYALLPITAFAFSWYGIIIVMALSLAFI